MPTRVKNKVDQNGVIKRQVINQNGADRKRKPCCSCSSCCCYKSGCFRVLLSARTESCCPATRMLRNLREKSKTALGCLPSMRRKQLKISSSTPISSKQPAASFDSHRNQAVEDCISYINSSTAPSSSSSSSFFFNGYNHTASPQKESPQIPQKLIATESAIAAATASPSSPPHFSIGRNLGEPPVLKDNPLAVYA